MASRRGPRRTRVYDANYSIGESYYKSALDNLDRKYTTNKVLPELIKPRIDFGSDLMEDDLSTARQRAHRAITEETVFDSRGARILKSGTPLETMIQDDVNSELARFRARSAARALEDVDSIGYLKAKVRSDIEDNTDHRSFIKRRVIKAVQSDDSAIQNSVSSLAKWTKVTDVHDAESFAAQKARETKARIMNIDDDMFERNERQAARDRRTANVKRMIADVNSDDVFTTKSTVRVSSVAADRKMVSF